MGALKRAGLITVARGTGGAELAHPPPPRKSLCSAGSSDRCNT
ncbi:MAG: hypothetical protein E6955_03035 [Bifidobacterium longum]|nr:hypothetical protein [Bifidobacterium longum]